MARAETIENVGETRGAVNITLPQQRTCRMGLPGPLNTWPGLLTSATITTGSGPASGAIHLHHNLHPLQALYLSYPPHYPQPVGQNEPQTHQHLPSSATPALPPCEQWEERGRGTAPPSVFSGEQTEEHQEASRSHGPLPDLLPQNEHPSWASPSHRAVRGEVVQELDIGRLASQLRAIGDGFNTTILQRSNAAPNWPAWRDACRGLLNFITQTLSTLYRLT